jgi:hypothetical protein
MDGRKKCLLAALPEKESEPSKSENDFLGGRARAHLIDRQSHLLKVRSFHFFHKTFFRFFARFVVRDSAIARRRITAAEKKIRNGQSVKRLAQQASYNRG